MATTPIAQPDVSLRRTVPFIARKANGQTVVLLDSFEIKLESFKGNDFLSMLDASLRLENLAEMIPEQVADEIVADQYHSALDFIFSHPIWAEFRQGRGKRTLLAYLLETRHYLQAAATRMAPGVASESLSHELTELLSNHMLEEVDHARYFENGLSILGCSLPVVQSCRPSPTTVEWIFLMRALSRRHPLCAALCSGFMEASAGEREAVKGWHQLLEEKKLLSKDVIAAIYEHVATDIELGHGGNWKEALEIIGSIPSTLLADCLNSITVTAEMIWRWLDSLESGLSGDLVEAFVDLPSVACPQSTNQNIDWPFRGLPVWPAAVLSQYVHGQEESPGFRRVIAIAFGANDTLPTVEGHEIIRAARDFSSKLNPKTTQDELESANDITAMISSWLRTIDGHELWMQMTEHPQHSLIYGWLLENYHYIDAVAEHVSPAIASCPDLEIQRQLIHHLEDEHHHAELLRDGLLQVPGPLAPERMRPLPTTLAFVGYLKELANTNWKAYCLALAFLQSTLSNPDHLHRNKAFYASVAIKAPELCAIVRAMEMHDTVDQDLNHGDQLSKMLESIATRHIFDLESISRAALLPQLAWGFLDGILHYYQHGPAALAARISWSGGVRPCRTVKPVN